MKIKRREIYSIIIFWNFYHKLKMIWMLIPTYKNTDAFFSSIEIKSGLSKLYIGKNTYRFSLKKKNIYEKVEHFLIFNLIYVVLNRDNSFYHTPHSPHPDDLK